METQGTPSPVETGPPSRPLRSAHARDPQGLRAFAPVGVAIAALVTSAALTHRVVFSAGNDASRFAQIESLVDFGRSDIGLSRYVWTIDRVQRGDRLYSNKPPIFAWMGSAAYATLQRLAWPAGTSFANDSPRVVPALVLLLVGVPAAALCVLYFHAVDALWTLSRLQSIVWTALLLVGTLIGSYLGTLNNHVLAALGLFAAVKWLLDRRPGWWIGAALGLSFAVDHLPAFLFAPVILFLCARRRGGRSALGCLAALLVGFGLAALANFASHGSILPIKMASGARDQAADMGSSIAGVLLPDDPLYPLLCLVGYHGVFLVSPILVLGVVGWIRTLGKRSPIDRETTAWLGAGIALIAGVHCLGVGWFGGWSFGYRYLIPVMPIGMLFAPAALEGSRTAWRWLAGALTAGSIGLTLLGAYHPWPPTAPQVSGWSRSRAGVPGLPTNPIAVNAYAFLSDWSGPDPWRWLGRWAVSNDRLAQERYLSDFYSSKQDASALARLADRQRRSGDESLALETARRALAIARDRHDAALERHLIEHSNR